MTLSLGTVLLFDDFHLHDRKQVVHLSEHGLKHLFNPRAIATLRARHGDITIQVSVPRLFTGNVSSGQEWCGDRLPWSLPLQRRVVFFQISEHIVSPSWDPANGATQHDIVGEQLYASVQLPVPAVAEPAAHPLTSAMRSAMASMSRLMPLSTRNEL